MQLRNRLASFCLLLIAGIAACDKTEERDPQFEPATAEKPFVPVNNPPTDLPPDAQKLLVPGKPAVNEPIDLVRDLGRLLEGITDRATATEKRMAVDGRMLALRKKLPDWEKPEGAVRAMLKEKGDDGVTVADRVLAQANAVLAIADAQPVHAYLQQLCVMLK